MPTGAGFSSTQIGTTDHPFNLAIELAQHVYTAVYSQLVAIGVVEQEYLTIVYTDRHSSARGLERRIISARRSNGRERNAYIETYEPATESGPSEP